MWKKISAVVIPTLIAVGIVAYMLYRVWDDLLLTLEHAVLPFLFAAVGICVTAWILRGGTGTGSSCRGGSTSGKASGSRPPASSSPRRRTSSSLRVSAISCGCSS